MPLLRGVDGSVGTVRQGDRRHRRESGAAATVPVEEPVPVPSEARSRDSLRVDPGRAGDHRRRDQGPPDARSGPMRRGGQSALNGRTLVSIAGGCLPDRRLARLPELAGPVGDEQCERAPRHDDGAAHQRPGRRVQGPAAGRAHRPDHRREALRRGSAHRMELQGQVLDPGELGLPRRQPVGTGRDLPGNHPRRPNPGRCSPTTSC